MTLDRAIRNGNVTSESVYDERGILLLQAHLLGTTDFNPSGIAYADKGSKRIKQKIAKLERNGKPANVATMAGARELSCFIWGMMTGNIA